MRSEWGRSGLGAGVQGVHLNGSVPLKSAEEVFRTVAGILGPWLRRIPDGETGVRSGWISWQTPFLTACPALEQREAHVPYSRGGPISLREGASGSDVHFEELGYAAAAAQSYPVFKELKAAGVIPRRCRFQVSLPTPLATVTAFIRQQDRSAVEPAYEQRILEELGEITASIQHTELAVQWDTAIEFAILEKVMPAHFEDARDGVLVRLRRLGDLVPEDVELGYHLCYGDAGHRHFKEPEDAGLLVEVANDICASLGRPVNWVHLPVPRERADPAYFAPLGESRLDPETELYLGLVHLTDGAEGARQRMKTALQVVPGFGVATECGLGRRPPETIPDLLRLHAQVAAPLTAERLPPQ